MPANNRRPFMTLTNIFFATINSFLSLLIERTKFSKRIFDFYGRVLPIPKTIVRGVPIKVIIPLHQIGIYNTFKSWEEREPEVLDWIDGFAKDSTFFDVGASFGTETLYAALKDDGPKKIVSFDLSLEASFYLAYNLSLNKIHNVFQYYLALSDKLGLQLYSEPFQYYYIKGKDKYEFVSYNTISISVDQFIAMTQIFPDYIKIDVDGAEQSIISGMSETVQNEKLRSVVIEVSDKSEPAITDFFHQAGFTIEFQRILAEEGERIFKNIIFTRR
jgi:FkbM family methyltransferase